MNELKGWMHQLVADMQTAILGRISDIDNSIQNLSDRVSSLEMHNEAVLQQTDESITAAITHQSPRHLRTRKVSSEIQGRIRQVYKNLGEEQQFRLDEGQGSCVFSYKLAALIGGRIDSEYNRKIVNLVAAEFDKDQYPIAIVKAGLVMYKRTMKRALTSDDAAPRRVKRSRQQRLWEKRYQMLKEEEKQLWGDIKPTMMSEEESDDENDHTLKRRRPSWRSDKLNQLIDVLDERINGSNSKRHTKRPRVEGPLIEGSTPPTAQPWMVREASLNV